MHRTEADRSDFGRMEWSDRNGHNAAGHSLTKTPEGGEFRSDVPHKVRMFTDLCESEESRIALYGLSKDHAYCIVAEATVDNRPDPPILLKSGFMPLEVSGRGAKGP